MKKTLTTLLVCFALLFPALAQADLFERMWFATGLIGGGTGDLDGAISGTSINVTDAAIVVDSNYNVYVFKVKMDGATENSPIVIETDDVGTGLTRWHLANSGVSNLIAYGYVKGGASIYCVYSGTTLTPDHLAGGMIYTFNTSPIVLGIPPVTGSTPYFMVKDMKGGGVTIQTTNGDVLYNASETGTAIFVNVGNSRHQATFNLVSESGTCAFVDVLGTRGGNWDVE